MALVLNQQPSLKQKAELGGSFFRGLKPTFSQLQQQSWSQARLPFLDFVVVCFVLFLRETQTYRDLTDPASQVLGLKVCVTTA